jgi:hypothetical protein
VLDGVQGARSKWGEEMGRILRDADETGAQFDMSRVARRVIDDIIRPNADNPALQGEVGAVADLMRRYIDSARVNGGGLPFSKANQWKSTLDGKMNWGNKWNNFGPSEHLEKYQKQLAGIFRDEIDNQLGDVLGPEAFDAFKKAKANVGTFKDAEGKARNLNAAREGNNQVSIKDLGVGALAGGGVPGVLATMASKLGRERGASTMAVAADRLSRAPWLERLSEVSPEVAEKYGAHFVRAAAQGEASVALLHFLLSQTDPQYQQAVQAKGLNP